MAMKSLPDWIPQYQTMMAMDMTMVQITVQKSPTLVKPTTIQMVWVMTAMTMMTTTT